MKTRHKPWTVGEEFEFISLRRRYAAIESRRNKALADSISNETGLPFYDYQVEVMVRHASIFQDLLAPYVMGIADCGSDDRAPCSPTSRHCPHD